MANHKSAKKRIKSSEVKRLRNRYQHKTTRTYLKKLRESTDKVEAEKLSDELKELNDGRVHFFNKNAADVNIMDEYIPVIKEITNGNYLKMLLHSIAFGTTTNFFGSKPEARNIANTLKTLSLSSFGS